ncbi:MAG TPA: TolC family protein [Holophagaceae bacterium]|nr:TolC family protein [Holophagaceae bacterium]
MVKQLFPVLLPAVLAAQDPGLTLPQAIRQAWERQPGLLAGDAQVEQARAEAAAARAGRLPTLQADAGWRRTDEPLMAFGMKLDQARITAADFDPARLNGPDPVSGLGASLALRQPIYAGGRIDAGITAARDLAGAAEARQARRRQEVAAAVVQAYFGSEAAAQGVAYAQDALDHARALETFVEARAAQGLLLKADALRAKAFRAQAEADLAGARQRQAEARNGLALLLGGPAPAVLATPLEAAPRAEGPAGSRSDLEAARLEARAAAAAAKAEGGSLKPELGVELGWGTARPTFGTGGATWTNLAVGARWTFSFAQTRKVQAARAAARAAEEGLRWQQAQADRDRADATAAVDAAEARVKAAAESLAAADEARRLTEARFQAGLLPLTDRLDAEARLTGARALQLSSLVELRAAEARQALADGRPVEGVQ